MVEDVHKRLDSEAEKPTFTFKGLSYLYHIERIMISPLGYDKHGMTYFEIRDAIENKQFFTAEISSLDEDLVVKDKYGIIRFCVHGWATLAQMDVYVNVRKPIGIVKDRVFYDQNKVPIYAAQMTTTGAFGCLGPPMYKVVTILGKKDIGYVTPEASSIDASFDQLIDEGPKALLLAFCLQLALAKYRMLDLHLQKIKYVYKDRAEHKAKKEREKAKMRASEAEGEQDASSVPVIYQPVPYAVPVPESHGSRRSSHKRDSNKVIVVKVPEQGDQTQPEINLPPIQLIVQPTTQSEVETVPPPPTIPPPADGSIQPSALRVSVTKRMRKVGEADSFQDSRHTSLISDVAPAHSRARASNISQRSRLERETPPPSRRPTYEVTASARGHATSQRNSQVSRKTLPDICFNGEMQSQSIMSSATKKSANRLEPSGTSIKSMNKKKQPANRLTPLDVEKTPSSTSIKMATKKKTASSLEPLNSAKKPSGISVRSAKQKPQNK